MSPIARGRAEPEAEALTPDQEAAVKAATAWVGLLGRTLKTCRLYDSTNPTVTRFRQDLDVALRRHVDEHGALTLRFTADDVLTEGVSLHSARSGNDNLGLAFYRDGVRGLTFGAGIQARELDALLDAILQVTGQKPSDDDLVTLLWQAHLPHLEVDFVPSESDMGGGGAGPSGDPGEPGESMPWPGAAGYAESESSSAANSPAAAASSAAAQSADAATTGAAGGRSDDWRLGEQTTEMEAGFDELESLAESETKRFFAEFEAEHQQSPVTASIGIARAYLDAGANTEDRLELARFMPRVLRQSLQLGAWGEARETIRVLERCESSEWSPSAFVQELQQPISITTVKERLEEQEPAVAAEFIELAGDLGEPAVDVLNLVLAEIQNTRHQRLLSDAIVERCRSNPERVAPWLADPRWFVVRNVVQILGAIGGPAIVGLLQAVVQHSEPRVRLEIIAALKKVDPQNARPLLMQLLIGADTRMFCSVLSQLAQARDPGTARLLLRYLMAEDFEQRSSEERRAIYSTLGATGGDEVVPELEVELHKGNWFNRGQDGHRQAVARCIARIGTPLARVAIERGAQSRRAPVRKVCEEVLGRIEPRE